MAISKVTICKKPVNEISEQSKKKVWRTCDVCKNVAAVSLASIYKSRRIWRSREISKKSPYLDFCQPCAMTIKNGGDNNPSKRQDVKQKMSENTRGKSKKFKDGLNPRICGVKITTNGYTLVHDGKQYRFLHVAKMEKKLGRLLTKEEKVHHIDGDKTNNDLSNLHLCDSSSKHSKIHGQLGKFVMDLVKKGLVQFDRSIEEYKLAPELELTSMPISLGFENIAIQQGFNECKSRLNASTQSQLCRGISIDVPLLAANMSTVVNSEFYIQLYKLGALGVMHRAADDCILEKEVQSISKKCDLVAASIGIGRGQLDLAKKLIKAGANILVVDVAHGYAEPVLAIAKQVKKYSPGIKVIVGNFICLDAVPYFNDWVDGIKVGIAQGLACETKNTAGCTEKQFSAVRKFSRLCHEVGLPYISDGGIREPGDYTKALAGGASSIMAGSIFARCPESAAPTVYIDGQEKKLYAGMASRYVQERWKGGLKPGTCPEGGIRYLPLGESVDKLIERYNGALKSGITYAGGIDIPTFQKIVRFVRLR